MDLDEAIKDWLRPVAATPPRGPGKIFYLVLAISGLAHLMGALILRTVEPAPYYGWEEPHLTLGTSAQHVRSKPVSPEPSRDVDWSYDAMITDTVRLRSSAPLATATVERITEVFARTVKLFPGWAGKTPIDLGAVDIRVVPLEVLNDPTYFDVDKNGTVYGLYFPRANIGYVTPVAFEHSDHLVHEVAHYLYDEYDVDVDSAQEESRVRKFERYYTVFEHQLDVPHVHADVLTEPSDLPRWRGAHRITADVSLRTTMVLQSPRALWIDHVVRVTEQSFSKQIGRPSRAIGELEIRVVGATRVGDLGDPDAPAKSYDARYFPAQRIAYVTPEVFRNSDALTHVLGHHLVRRYGLLTSEEEEERVVHTLTRRVKLRLMAIEDEARRSRVF